MCVPVMHICHPICSTLRLKVIVCISSDGGVADVVKNSAEGNSTLLGAAKGRPIF